MSVTELAAGDLVYEGARRVLEEHERMILTGTDGDAFFDALPEPAEALVAALKRRRELFGLSRVERGDPAARCTDDPGELKTSVSRCMQSQRRAA